MKEALSSFVGIAVSLTLHLWPRARDWWANRRAKVLILLTFHVGGALAIWTLHCILGFSFPFALSCTPQGLASAGWAGTVGFIAGQSTYGLTTYAIPYVKARFHALHN